MQLGLDQRGKIFLLTCWLPALALLQGLCLVLAWHWYPRYSMFNHDISFLGHPQKNPAGWWCWSLAMGLTGLMMWPVTTWLSRRMRELTAGQTAWRRRLVAIGSLSARSSCFGLLALALIPQTPGLDAAHQAAGAFAFSGMYLAMLFFWCVPLWSSSLGAAKALCLTLAAYWGPVGWFATQGYRWFAYGEIGRGIKVPDQSIWLRFSLWEWMLFFCSSISLPLLVLMLPDHTEGAGK